MRFDRLIEQILEGKDPVGMDTYWQDGKEKVTIKDVIKHLDFIKAPIKEVSMKKIKPIIIDQDYEGAGKERVQKANLQYPLIVTVSKGKYKSILDGNHRAFKALTNDIDTVKVRELDLDSKDTPQIYKNLFNYSIKPLKKKV
jgi:hypothetical protein